MEPPLATIIGVVGVLARHRCVGARSNIRCATALMFMAAFFFRSSRSVFSMGRRSTRMTNPDDAEITRSNDARFRDQSNTPIHKS
jgi:hypothetical protein